MERVVPKRFLLRTKRGRILRVVRERYLRDDVGFGSVVGGPTESTSTKSNPPEQEHDESEEATTTTTPSAWHRVTSRQLLTENDVKLALRDEHVDSSGRPLLLVLDTNVVLAQLDVLEAECPALVRSVLNSVLHTHFLPELTSLKH